jgi:hypothetical protein
VEWRHCTRSVRKVSDFRPLEFPNNQKSQGVISGVYGAWVTTGVWVFGKKKGLNPVRGMCWSIVNCLLTTTPVSCTTQHHIGDWGHPCSSLWWLFDPVVRNRGE